MSHSRIGLRYAKALLLLSQSHESKAAEHLKAVRLIKELFGMDESAKIMRSPVMPVSFKLEPVRVVLDGAGIEASALTEAHRFVETIATAGRVSWLPQIADAFEHLLNERAGILDATLESVVPIASGDQQALRQALETVFAQKINLKPTIDRSLLGGFLVRVGNKIIDFSIKTKLEALAQSAVQ